MSKDKSSSKTEHVSGPPIISSIVGYKGCEKTTITDSEGNKTTGYGRTAEESQKNASKKAGK